MRRFRDFGKSLGKTPRLHQSSIELSGIQFAVFSTHEPENGTFPIVCVNGGLIFEHKLLWPALSALAARRRVIHGLADVLTFEMEQETVRRLGPAATLLPVPAAGHNAFLEQPSVVFPAIEAFLTAAERTTTL